MCAGKVAVVDGKPIRRNQSMVLSMATSPDSKVLHLLANSEAGLARMAALAGVEELTPSGAATMGELSYHAACVDLLAGCCVGKEPEHVVKVRWGEGCVGGRGEGWGGSSLRHAASILEQTRAEQRWRATLVQRPAVPPRRQPSPLC